MLARLVAQTKARPDVSMSRALWVAAFIAFWMLAVCARLVYLQVSQHHALGERARQQQQNALETSPQRGELLDRHGRQLARSVTTVSLFVDPEPRLKAEDLERTAHYVAKTLGVKFEDLAAQLKEAQSKGRRFVWIARRLDAALVQPLLDLNLPGLGSYQEPKRYWPRCRRG